MPTSLVHLHHNWYYHSPSSITNPRTLFLVFHNLFPLVLVLLTLSIFQKSFSSQWQTLILVTQEYSFQIFLLGSVWLNLLRLRPPQEGGIKMVGDVCTLYVRLSVCRVPRPNLRTVRPRKLNIGVMEAHRTGNHHQWIYLVVKRSKIQGHQAEYWCQRQCSVRTSVEIPVTQRWRKWKHIPLNK